MQTTLKSGQLPDDFWPAPLAHCASPLVTDADEEIVVGEITSDPANGFLGNRMLYTTLVPVEDADSVLKEVGGIGHGVSCDARQRLFAADGTCHPPFWVDDPGRRVRFETLVHSWVNHNRLVLLPDSALLMCYGLTPRVLRGGSISWDDLDRPVYDVVRVVPLSHYSMETGYTTARVTIQRDYLEDYLDLKGCAAVATYYDERYSLNEKDVEALIGGKGTHYQQPGRQMWFLPMGLEGANQISQVWACALLIKPSRGQPITEPTELELAWPDRALPVKGSGRQASFEPFEPVYVRDEVLVPYEERGEFDISPESGAVSYDSRWSVSYCSRFGRNHIEIELRKLYEGTPIDVIRHFHKFAVRTAAAENERQNYGARHIGIRAKELVYGFLEVTTTLSALCGAAGLPLTQEDIGQFNTSDVAYQGWWRLPAFKLLGRVNPLTLTFPAFLGRCKEVFKILENLRPGPLRQLLVTLGVKKEQISELGGMRLFATVCQCAAISAENGLDLRSDSAQVVARWDGERILEFIKPLFALNMLRTADAHSTSPSIRAKITEALDVFGIDESRCLAGWGLALDVVYDRIVSSLEEANELIGGAWNNR
jgi:hypothetical protein